MNDQNAQGFYQMAIDFKNLATDGLDKHIEQGLTIAGITIQDAARNLVPIDTGELRKNIQSTVTMMTGDSTAIIKANEPYAYDVEFGTAPGRYVSPQELMGWAIRHGMNPYAVSKSIFKKGTKAQPYLFPAFDQSTDAVILIIGQALQNALAEVSG